jgi:small-conductance mechanosensitive channel
LANALASVKKFIIITVLLIICTSAAIFLFEQQVAEPVKLSTLLRQSIDTAIVIIAGSLIVFLIRRFRNAMVKRIGPQLATIFQLFMMLIAIVITLFTVLDIFQVSATALLLGGGIITLVIGLIVSNLIGNTFAGTMILISNAFKVGDNVLVNNVPGRIEEITTMFTRIRNDMGGMIVIPNTALISGSIIVTKMPHDDSTPGSRLPYVVGDRVYTTYLNENGTVKEVTPLQTKILLDSGKTITFLNTSVMTGMVAIARIDQTRTASELKTRKNKPEHAETSSATPNEQRA